MDVGAAVRPARALPAYIESDGAKLTLVALAYFVGAELAFVVGTLSDKIFAPFWPPNIVLLYALVFAPARRWWLYILATFPAHVVAELGIGMGAQQLLVAFATNALLAVIIALAMIRVLGGPPRFDNVRGATTYILVAALISPALVALGGAFVPITGGGAITKYWTFWAQWFLSNALGALTLGSAAFIWLRQKSSPPMTSWRRIEALLLAAALVVVCTVAFELGTGSIAIGFLPALLYSPLPLILWAAVRFGARGASGAVVMVTVVLTWRALNGPSLFVAGDSETNVFALQIFLVALAIPVLLLGTAIEEVRRAERTTREREEQMAFAAASANIGLWQYEHAGNRFWATEHCRAMLSVPPGAPLTWEAIRNCVQPEDRDALIDLVRAARIESPAEHEFRVRDPDGQIRWIAARARTEFDAGATPTRVSGLLTDITRRKQAEHEIDLQRKELAHLMRVGMVGELSGAIAHELNQPLTAILANAQAARRMLAQTSPDAHEIEDALDDIVRDDNRAGEVIRRLRGLLKKDAGRSEPVDLNGLVEAALRLLHGELVGRTVKVELNLQPGLPHAFGDPIQLQQVLLNLVMNSIEAMGATPPAERVVRITTRSTDQDRIEVVVADRGCGLSPDAKARLFMPFFTTKEHGLGLGLSICSTIVRSCGGELGLTGNARGGATATMTLPLPERMRHAHEKRIAAT